MGASNCRELAIAKPDHAKAQRALARLQAKADRLVYEHVNTRDGLRCRACGTYAGIDAHRHHIVSKKITTKAAVCNVCPDCHSRMHVRIGGKTLKISGNAEQRNKFGVPNGLTIEMRQQDSTWVSEEGR